MTDAGAAVPLFPEGAPIRRVFGHPVVMLGAGRALLLQLAHPAVARGVAEHSSFDTDPFGRLQRTLDAVNAIVYGTVGDATTAAAAVRAAHRRVRGDGYDATDPALVGWVHATLVDTALRMHARWVRPVPPDVAEAFYADAVVLGELFGAPRASQPSDLGAFRAYVRSTIGDLAPRIGDEQRCLARAVLHPPVPVVVDPLVAVARQLTVGQLPAPLRRAFGFGWDLPREAALQASGLGARLAAAQLRLARRVVPVHRAAAEGDPWPNASPATGPRTATSTGASSRSSTRSARPPTATSCSRSSSPPCASPPTTPTAST
jgi:uncharacterized protein (DUF2236 family)